VAFDFSGGALCLDFANTVEDRPHYAKEGLHAYPDLLRWVGEAGVLPPQQVEDLLRRSTRHARLAGGTFDEAIALREAIYRTFSALARGSEPAGTDLAALNRGLGEALPWLRVEHGGEAFGWAWRGPADRLDAPLWPVVRSAAELLTSGGLAALRECASGSCSWLFIDRSRSRRRRWCSMKTCGNRAKARRHYARTRSAGE
jgi:predicted RNA-binding Zn ribbon-like protein